MQSHSHFKFLAVYLARLLNYPSFPLIRWPVHSAYLTMDKVSVFSCTKKKHKNKETETNKKIAQKAVQC